jgi:2-phospho-L-lactate guanylyltransferase
MIWGLIAARLGAETKKRLEPALAPTLRRKFAQAMLADVITALLGSEKLAGVSVLAGDQEAADLAAKLGAVALHDTGEGLNTAVAAGMGFARNQNADGVVIAMGDLPILTAADIDRLIDALPTRGLVAAPSRDGSGTNLLGLRPPGLISTHFGNQSLAAHQQAARDADVKWQQIEPGGSALDVDTPEDLQELQRQLHTSAAPARETRKSLRAAGL